MPTDRLSNGIYSTVPQTNLSVMLGPRSWIQNRRPTQHKAVKTAKVTSDLERGKRSRPLWFESLVYVQGAEIDLGAFRCHGRNLGKYSYVVKVEYNPRSYSEIEGSGTGKWKEASNVAQ